MKQKYIQTVMLIQGPKQSGNNINLCLELLKEDLETLWDEEGVNMWDANAQNYFPLKAALITMVHDYLGYGYVSVQVCHGQNGCVKCMDDTTFRQLPRYDPSKTIFMGHQRWLAEDDEWRTWADLFDGIEETWGPSRQRTS
jgi:hypothetical protein